MYTSPDVRRSSRTTSFTTVYPPRYPSARSRSKIRFAVWRCFFGIFLSS